MLFRPEPAKNRPVLAPLLSYSLEVVKYSARFAQRDCGESKAKAESIAISGVK